MSRWQTFWLLTVLLMAFGTVADGTSVSHPEWNPAAIPDALLVVAFAIMGLWK